MIKASELQLGNLYFHKGIIDDFKHHMVVKDYDDWDPIPLTSEWLERCGFTFEMNHNSDGDEVEWLEHPKMKGITFRNGLFHRDLGTEEMTNLKHLHQLQNLFRAITGQELEFNPHL